MTLTNSTSRHPHSHPNPADTRRYIGRFAPSPTGPLHFGSLVAALASYLDAKAARGTWLVRMEDLDPPREVPGAADTILEQLCDLGLTWDGQVLYQSTRLEAYEDAMQQLFDQDLCFFCSCTRTRIQSLGAVYDGHCRSNSGAPDKISEPFAIRLKVHDQLIEFNDRIQGRRSQNLNREVGDFIIKRKDKFFAYQLAVAVDDAFQQVSDIVRGHDLIDSTPRQIYLQQQLGLQTPLYAHIPVATNSLGEKLSKQQHANEINTGQGSDCLFRAMHFLGLKPPIKMANEKPSDLLAWGVKHWNVQNVPKLATISAT